MDYNTKRDKLIMPEYGRHIQRMVEKIKKIEDKEKRSQQAKALVSIMGILKPTMKEVQDYRHKFWDHLQVISDFDLDIDSPFTLPTVETFHTKPDKIAVEKTHLKAAHYGRNIQNMIEVIASKEEGEKKDSMIKALAVYMRQQYLIWNKDAVSQETIFNDIAKLSGGKLIVPEHIQLEAISDNETFSRPGIMKLNSGGRMNGSHNRNSNKKNNNNNRNKNGNRNNNNQKKKWNNKNKNSHN